MSGVTALPKGSDLVSRDDLAEILSDSSVAADAGLATVAVLEAHVGVAAVAANVAAIAATTDITAVPASFADLPALRAYLAGANVVPNVEARLDALELKINALLSALVTAGLMSAS